MRVAGGSAFCRHLNVATRNALAFLSALMRRCLSANWRASWSTFSVLFVSAPSNSRLGQVNFLFLDLDQKGFRFDWSRRDRATRHAT